MILQYYWQLKDVPLRNLFNCVVGRDLRELLMPFDSKSPLLNEVDFKQLNEEIWIAYKNIMFELMSLFSNLVNPEEGFTLFSSELNQEEALCLVASVLQFFRDDNNLQQPNIF